MWFAAFSKPRMNVRNEYTMPYSTLLPHSIAKNIRIDSHFYAVAIRSQTSLCMPSYASQKV